MITFFVLVVLVGGVLLWLDSASTTSDSIPIELSGHAGIGGVMIAVGFIGALCVRFVI